MNFAWLFASLKDYAGERAMMGDSWYVEIHIHNTHTVAVEIKRYLLKFDLSLITKAITHNTYYIYLTSFSSHLLGGHM